MLRRLVFSFVSFAMLAGLSGCLSLPHAPGVKTLQQMELPQQYVSHLSSVDAQALELYHVGKPDTHRRCFGFPIRASMRILSKQLWITWSLNIETTTCSY